MVEQKSLNEEVPVVVTLQDIKGILEDIIRKQTKGKSRSISIKHRRWRDNFATPTFRDWVIIPTTD